MRAIPRGILTMGCCCLVAFAVVAAGCGEDAGKPAGSTQAPGGPTTNVTPLKLSANQVKQLSEKASALERGIFEDGTVSFSEYETAVFASVQCFKDAGIRVTIYPSPQTGGANLPDGPKLTGRGEYQYLPEFPPGTPQKQATDLLAKCDQGLVGVIRPLWLGHISPTASDTQAARDGMGACLRDAGHDVPQHPASEDLLKIAFPPDGQPPAGKVDLPPDYEQCAEKAAEQLGVPSFIG